MSTLDPDMGALVADAIRGLGIELRDRHRGRGLRDRRRRSRRARSRRATARSPADVVVLGIGVKPNVGARRRRRHRDRRDAAASRPIARMATSADGVWAAGDCVETFHRVTRRPVAIALGTHANKQGRVVGVNVTGGDATFARRHRHRGHEGLRVRDRPHRPERARGAATPGSSSSTATIESTTRAGYYPGATPITVKVRRRAAHRPAARRADHRPGRRGQAHRRDGGRDLERDDRRRDRAARPRLRAAVLAGVGPDADRRAQAAADNGDSANRGLRGRSLPSRSFSYIICTSSSKLTVGCPAELLAAPSTRRRSAGRPRPAGRSADPA